MKNKALIIGNEGLGDLIVCIGIVNYIATKYEKVIVACLKKVKEQVKNFYINENIEIYSIDEVKETNMRLFDWLMRDNDDYDVYAYGHFGAYQLYNDYTKQVYENNKLVIKPIIYDYPISYYEDLKIPIEYSAKYFEVKYPKEIDDIYDELFKNFPKYTVIHQESSNVTFNIVRHNSLNIEKTLTIDVNNNLYPIGHKFYNICQKFVNLRSITYYKRLVENASALLLLDSCIHALCLVSDITKSKVRICYQREKRIKYGFDKFKYYLLVNNKPIDVKLPC